MENDREYSQQPGNEGSDSSDRKEKFNELSELSLEERMAVADRIGIPDQNESDALTPGSGISGDELDDLDDGMEEETLNDPR